MGNGVQFDVFADEMRREAGLAVDRVAAESIVLATVVDAEVRDFVFGWTLDFRVRYL